MPQSLPAVAGADPDVSTQTWAEAKFDEHVRQAPRQAKAASDELDRLLVERGVLFGKTPLPTSLKPLFVAAAAQHKWVSAIERFLDLGERLIGARIGDARFYDFLGLSPLARSLIEIDPGYERLGVICRPDAVCHGDDVSLFEVNADSPAMMTCADVIEEFQRRLFPLADMSVESSLSGRTDRTAALLQGLLATYRAWGGTCPSPTIAIVDWQDEATHAEQELTAAIFGAHGSPALVCDPRDLVIEGGRLRAHGREIDIVHRRVLFPDFLKRAPELETFVRAYRERLVCVVNPLRSFLLGHKAALAWLAAEAERALSPEERAIVAAVMPPTRLLAPSDRDEVIGDQRRWVLKPTTGHGGHKVLIGAGLDEKVWRDAVDGASGQWLLQEFRQPLEYVLPSFVDDTPSHSSFIINWNPFLYSGRFGGAIGRASKELVVNIRAGGALLPAVAV